MIMCVIYDLYKCIIIHQSYIINHQVYHHQVYHISDHAKGKQIRQINILSSLSTMYHRVHTTTLYTACV